MKNLSRFFLVAALCVTFLVGIVGCGTNNSEKERLDKLNGYDDLYWGESLEEVQKTWQLKGEKVLGKGIVAYGIMMNETHAREYMGIPIKVGVISFYNNKLMDIYLILNDKNAYSKLEKILVESYGEPKYRKYGRLGWLGETTVLGIDKKEPDAIKFSSIELLSEATGIEAPKR